MRKLLISAAVTALFILPALAQPDHDHGPGGGGSAPESRGGAPGGGHPEHGGGAPHPGPNPSLNRGPNGGNSGRPTMTSNPGYSRGPNGGGFNHPAPGANPAYTRGPNGGGDFHQGGSNMAGHQGPGGNFNRTAPGFNHAGPGGGGHHDFRTFGDFHQDFNAPRHFHAGAYRRPPGWYPHHWTFGEYLPAAFWARDYWLADYVDFGLPPPPYGAVWVRNGDDALLIDQDSGEIITVEYSVFY